MSAVHLENFRFLSSIVLEILINVWSRGRRESLCFNRRESFLQTLDDNISVKYCQKLLIFLPVILLMLYFENTWLYVVHA